MCRTLFIILLTAIGFSLAQAQDKPKPNLSGKWVVDLTRSEKTGNFLEDSELSVIIEQHEPEIRLTSRFESLNAAVPFVFYTDGRDASYVNPGTRSTVKTKTKWEGDKLVIHFTGVGTLANKAQNINTIHEFKLSKDGNTLTKKIIVVMPRSGENRINSLPVPQANQEFTKVYKRAP
jgi:hypothetical protein